MEIYKQKTKRMKKTKANETECLQKYIQKYLKIQKY